MTPKAKAHEGFALLKLAIRELLESEQDGLTNAEIAEQLDLRSSYGKGAKDYLTWAVLGEMLKEGTLVRRGRRYVTR